MGGPCDRHGVPGRLVNTQPAAVEAFRQEFMKTSECRRLELSCRQQLSSRRAYDGRRTRNSWRHILRRLLR
jgi:hypothetical protein